MKDKQPVAIAAVVLSPLVIALLTLGSLTLKEARAAKPNDAGIQTKFIRTNQKVSLCLNGRPLY
jgi:hypothetical protein